MALFGLGLLVLLRAVDPGFIKALRLGGFDLEQQISPRVYQEQPVRIVAIDEQSLSKYGQWPWPRTLVAKLVKQIAVARPLVLGVDIIFAEPDRLSPDKFVDARPDLPAPLARELALLPSNEAALAEAFSEVPTVLGIGSSEAPSPAPPQPTRTTIVRESGTDPRPFLRAFPNLQRSLPELTAVASAQGVILDNPDPDGITRRLPLFVVSRGQLVPALALEMLRVASGGGTLGILAAKDGVLGSSVDGVFIPTDAHDRAYPYFTPSYENRYISAANLLDRSYDPSVLQGRIVLLGVIGQGASDLRQTPLGLMAGVEVHAQLIECILSSNILRRPAKLHWIEIVLVFGVGLITIFPLPYRRPRVAGAAWVILVLLLFGGAFGCFRFFNLLVDTVYPSLASLAMFGVMLTASSRAAEAERRRLAVELEHERQIEARLEGELNAARSIQMGLLPHRFPGPPENRDVDLYAVIEPARMVGGDLYDFLLLDPERIFFAVADVSGKGVPAALFMAMTKEVLHDAVSRHDEDLDRAFAEANARISAANGDMVAAGGDMMFVTVFAGILNLASGALACVNAGHDSPFLVRVGAEAKELAGQGGPPLGTVDDFPYAVDRHQLTPGDSLLLYTDGVTEAEDRNDRFYGEARLALLLLSAPTESARALVEFVREDVRRFATDAEQADDITVLAVRWTSAQLATS